MVSSTAKITAFEYQLELLKVELNQIDSAIRQMDDITKSIKDWAIVTWTFSLGSTLQIGGLKPYIGLTAIIPLLFWMVDARYRRIQKRFIYRLNQISNFLNDERLIQSFDEQKLINFRLLDPRAKKSHDDDYDSYISMFRILRFGSVAYLYFGLILISLLIHFLRIIAF